MHFIWELINSEPFTSRFSRVYAWVNEMNEIFETQTSGLPLPTSTLSEIPLSRILEEALAMTA
jgi:hypothetical protein